MQAHEKSKHHVTHRDVFDGLAVSILSLTWVSVAAQGLPPPPVSPAPVARYEYDANGNVTKQVQSKLGGGELTTVNAYDRLNRLITSTDPLAGVVELKYDGLGRLTQVKDPRSLVTQYPRNGLGDATSLISPDTGTATHTYDSAGRLKTRTDSRGVLATYSYDALDRLTSIVYSQSGKTSQSFTWTYDQTGAGFSNGVGRLTSTSFAGGSSQYSYDPQGRLVGVAQTTLNPLLPGRQLTQSIQYNYNSVGQLVSLTYPSGRQLRIGYANGQVSDVSLAKSASDGAAVALLQNIQWEPFGGVRGWQWMLSGSAVWHDRSYDANGRLVRHSLGSWLRDLRYDEADRIVSFTHYDVASGAVQPAMDQSFAYDDVGRLTQISTASANWSLAYDANGNRTAVVLNGNASSYGTAADSNRLMTLTNPARTLGYDAAGNRISDAGVSFAYDLTGRMQSATKGGVTTSYGIDGLGRRLVKSRPGDYSGLTFYLYGLGGELLGEYTISGQPVREYVWLGNLPVAMFQPPEGAITGDTSVAPLLFTVHSDHLGTPRLVTDASNQLRWSWLGEPFGSNAANENPSGLGTLVFNLRLPGQVFDAETGLHYNYFRDYDASTGQYVQSDPLGLVAGVNTFAYVGGDSVSRRDPAGLMDSLTARVMVMVAQGDIEGAIIIAEAGGAGGIILASRLQQFQASIQTLTSRYPLATNKCVEVAEGIAKAAKSLNMNAQFLRIAPARTPFVYIGDKYTAIQHFAVRFGDRVYDSYTGVQGMAYSQYINMLNSSNLGPGSYVVQTINSLGPYK